MTDSQQSQTPQRPAEDGQADDLIVEAALFSAGRPLSADEIADQTGLSGDKVTDALIGLREAYQDRRTALDIVKSGHKWALALSGTYAEQTRHIVPPEVPRHVVRTLALIAYHQPILQSDLKDLVGSKVYEHVGHLVEAGMVRKTPDGLTYALSTTSDFPEYFGIPEDDPERIRNFLAEKVGIEPETGEDVVGQYEPGDLDLPDPEDQASEATDDEAPADEALAEDPEPEAEPSEGHQEPIEVERQEAPEAPPVPEQA